MQDYTALVLVVDCSGSMLPIADDMEGGISALIAKQRELPGVLTIDTVYFDTQVILKDHFASPDEVEVRLNTGGMTALYDAIGTKIDQFGAALAELPDSVRPDKVLFAIVTDGHENASREYRQEQVRDKIKHQTEAYGWEFTYLGANQDAVLVAEGIGIRGSNALTFNTKNVAAMTQTFDSYVTNTRSGIASGYTDADRTRNQ